MKKLKVITILGTRPEITKLSPVLPVFDKEFDHKVIHTGQHYSYTMDRIFFEELRLRKPDYNLNVGSGTHAEQTAKMLIGIEKILIKEKPDYVVVFADPNTPLAGALAAAKLHIKVVHMEAGTRSFNRKMPEEINRVLIDHCSDILLAPDKKAVQNLAKEGIEKNVYLVGSTAYEAALRNGEFAKNSNLLNKLKIKKREYILTTVHRAENTNDKKVLGELIGAVNNISEYIDIVLPLHPRTLKLCGEYGIKINKKIKLIQPQGYIGFLKLLDNALFVMSDSGGIQEEAAALNVPCLILRNETEWTYLTDLGKNILIGIKKDKIVKTARILLKNKQKIEKMRKINVNLKKGIGMVITRILKNAEK